MNTKVCSKCKVEKELNEFKKHQQCKQGVHSQCKKCLSENDKLYSTNNKDILNQKKEIKRQEKIQIKKEKVNDRLKPYLDKYLGLEFGSFKIIEYVGYFQPTNQKHKRHHFKKECKFCGKQVINGIKDIKVMLEKNSTCNLCRESINIHTKEKKCNSCNQWFQANSDNFPLSKNRPFGIHYYCRLCHLEKNRKRRESPDVRKQETKQKIQRYKTDNLFRLIVNIRELIKKSLKRKSHKKTCKTQDILGCSFENFKLHLESKFQTWMNWDNYGNPKDGIFELNKSWDIDHIIPISSAKTKEDIIRLNHYTNLQPLCSLTNRRIKRNKITNNEN
jgi:hypothetical protein